MMSQTPPSLQHATAIHLSSEEDDPRQARVELLHLVQKYNALLDNLGSAAFKNTGINEGDLVALTEGGMFPQSLQPSRATVAVGTLLDFFRETPPEGWLEANGQGINNQHSDHRDLFLLLFSLATRSQSPLTDLFASIQDREAAAGINAESAWGDGLSMKLPDIRGRSRIGTGQGEGLTTSRDLGDKLGEEAVTLDRSNLPSIQLSLKRPQYTSSRSGHSRKEFQVTSARSNVFVDSSSEFNNRTEIMGNDTAHENMQPSFVVLTCIKY